MVRYAWPGWWLGLLLGFGSPLAAQANLPEIRRLADRYVSGWKELVDENCIAGSTLVTIFKRRIGGLLLLKGV